MLPFNTFTEKLVNCGGVLGKRFMSIKDPIDALEKHFENEDRSSDPVVQRLARLASELPLPWPADKGISWITGRLAANRIERIELMLAVIRDELRRHEDQLQVISQAPREETQHRLAEWLTLVEDGAKKAERTRAKERVERIGKILAKSLLLIPAPDADDVEEMTRIAMDLSDHDVDLLNELVRVQSALLGANGRVPRFQAWTSWPKGRWGIAPDGNADSVFSKLESFGLVSRLAPPNNLNISAEIQDRYGLLRKGLEFVRFIQQQQ